MEVFSGVTRILLSRRLSRYGPKNAIYCYFSTCRSIKKYFQRLFISEQKDSEKDKCLCDENKLCTHLSLSFSQPICFIAFIFINVNQCCTQMSREVTYRYLDVRTNVLIQQNSNTSMFVKNLSFLNWIEKSCYLFTLKHSCWLAL